MGVEGLAWAAEGCATNTAARPKIVIVAEPQSLMDAQFVSHLGLSSYSPTVSNNSDSFRPRAAATRRVTLRLAFTPDLSIRET